MPDVAKEVQIVLLRQMLFDPEKSAVWPTMRAVADGPKAICDAIIEVEKSKGDEWCANFVRTLEAATSLRDDTPS